jgi:hypothetical protein
MITNINVILEIRPLKRKLRLSIVIRAGPQSNRIDDRIRKGRGREADLSISICLSLSLSVFLSFSGTPHLLTTTMNA